ncbi:hypothetical protein PPYR_11343 [Photinus pyralis]|uniref:Uncharacterized protein n=1 Tax=Photinus pyralis TaxID=7054 RepID=A0A5N4AB16_PHOPY|nr:uncharacterized protein LOC116175543 [Photinus pyralis]KAB0794504.1 hypothetical protein PPYR_11343 [Photinus pyralis]
MSRFLVFSGVLIFATSLVNCSREGVDFRDGAQIIGKLFRHFVNSQPEDYQITDGVHLISTSTANDIDSRSVDDLSLMGVIENYVRTHEVRIKFTELMPDGQDLARAFRSDGDEGNSEVGTARGKNKGGGGGGGLMMLGGMFGSMMGAIGLGGVGLLAMKALAVSAMALMLAAVIGVKSLASGGGHEDHRVIHAGGHDHRKKREAAEMAYNAWYPYVRS